MAARLAIVPLQDLPFESVLTLFAAISADESARTFHPHPMTADEAARRHTAHGHDVHVLAALGAEPVAYGLLRGWDDGFAVPSLGIWVAAGQRGTGIAQLLMEYLHTCARMQGANSVRLRVASDNKRALQLYLRLGYRFEGIERGEQVGVLDLGSRSA